MKKLLGVYILFVILIFTNCEIDCKHDDPSPINENSSFISQEIQQLINDNNCVGIRLNGYYKDIEKCLFNNVTFRMGDTIYQISDIKIYEIDYSNNSETYIINIITRD